MSLKSDQLEMCKVYIRFESLWRIVQTLSDDFVSIYLI